MVLEARDEAEGPLAAGDLDPSTSGREVVSHMVGRGAGDVAVSARDDDVYHPGGEDMHSIHRYAVGRSDLLVQGDDKSEGIRHRRVRGHGAVDRWQTVYHKVRDVA